MGIADSISKAAASASGILPFVKKKPAANAADGTFDEALDFEAEGRENSAPVGPAKPAEGSATGAVEPAAQTAGADVASSLAMQKADVEYMHGQVDFLKHGRVLFEERFAHLSEQISELRAQISQLERVGGQARLAADRASALLGSVQPERLAADVNRIHSRCDELRSCMESLGARQKSLEEEVRRLRAELAKSGGAAEGIPQHVI